MRVVFYTSETRIRKDDNRSCEFAYSVLRIGEVDRMHLAGHPEQTGKVVSHIDLQVIGECWRVFEDINNVAAVENNCVKADV